MNEQEFLRRLEELYLPPEKRFSMVDVPALRYCAIDGTGNPADQTYAAAVKWLFSVVHFIKPAVKERLGKNFVEPPLECLYWADCEEDFISGKRDKLKWRVMIVFPEWESPELFQEAVANVEGRRGQAPVRLVQLNEGKSVQIMHIGDAGEIGSICDQLYNRFLPEHRLTPNGLYHEIYLNDPARVAPEKRKTVIRQPVK